MTLLILKEPNELNECIDCLFLLFESQQSVDEVGLNEVSLLLCGVFELDELLKDLLHLVLEYDFIAFYFVHVVAYNLE